MFFYFPCIISENVHPDVVPALCKTLEKYFLVHVQEAFAMGTIRVKKVWVADKKYFGLFGSHDKNGYYGVPQLEMNGVQIDNKTFLQEYGFLMEDAQKDIENRIQKKKEEEQEILRKIQAAKDDIEILQRTGPQAVEKIEKNMVDLKVELQRLMDIVRAARQEINTLKKEIETISKRETSEWPDPNNPRKKFRGLSNEGGRQIREIQYKIDQLEVVIINAYDTGDTAMGGIDKINETITEYEKTLSDQYSKINETNKTIQDLERNLEKSSSDQERGQQELDRIKRDDEKMNRTELSRKEEKEKDEIEKRKDKETEKKQKEEDDKKKRKWDQLKEKEKEDKGATKTSGSYSPQPIDNLSLEPTVVTVKVPITYVGGPKTTKVDTDNMKETLKSNNGKQSTVEATDFPIGVKIIPVKAVNSPEIYEVLVKDYFSSQTVYIMKTLIRSTTRWIYSIMSKIVMKVLPWVWVNRLMRSAYVKLYRDVLMAEKNGIINASSFKRWKSAPEFYQFAAALVIIDTQDIKLDNFLADPQKIKHLFNLGWNTFAVTDSVNQRCKFCSYLDHGHCYDLSYKYIFESIGKTQLYETLDMLKKQASPFSIPRGNILSLGKTLDLQLQRESQFYESHIPSEDEKKNFIQEKLDKYSISDNDKVINIINSKLTKFNSD